MYRPRDRKQELTPEQAQRLTAGRHESLARELRAAGKAATAGWVLEQIWDFEGALACYLEAGLGLESLRVALELRDPAALGRALAALADASAADRRQAAALLQQRGRHFEAANLLADAPASAGERAAALLRGGDRVGAARLLEADGQPHAALAALAPLLEGRPSADALALAARLAWALGDAETAVRRAQAALRGGQGSHDRAELHRLLARSLASLGHDLAAQIALESVGEASAAEALMPGRYHVRRTIAAAYAGSAYAGVDRVTLQEVEIHLLLADLQEGAVGPDLHAALARFAQSAEAGARLAHPAIRPIVRLDPDAGLLVLPLAEGPPLGALIRPPGMAATPTRARALVAFLLEGLAAAHARGLVHGSILPSQIVCDAAGRPLLGPFGADHLAGLAATRTGALEEVLTITAPERRHGGPATAASDIYSVGAIFAALLVGEIGGDLDRLDPAERALVHAAAAADPDARPDAAALLRGLRSRSADPRELHGGADDLSPGPGADERLTDDGAALVVAADTWPDAHLDELAAVDEPWFQPILDRRGRRFYLAPWPPECGRAPAGARPALPAAADARLSPTLRAALHARLRPEAWVRTAGGAWMLALDDLLAR